ncbi:MAG: Dipeptide transport system permease protein DppB [Candidatus Bipolaricaulis sibiricus]|uniref:Dipeptide transport system permease protein DppB n=1 Tax=Bipolaricaulis sibiricus TaxID=2501609 RepID=A0A410FS27_BIPS1|nr:MAG: Dipeptide transport system permease protein DppB [Candidatus Bipolaricaulis sibiricus]
MLSYIVRRLLLAIPVLLGVVTLVFLALRLIPGDPALVMAGEAAPQEVVARIRTQLGLDRPLTVQYGIYIWNLLRGDLGRSARTRRPVTQELGFRLPATLELASASMAIAILLGLTAGIISATRQYSVLDYGTMVGALMGISIPVFWFGLMAMWIFSVRLGWFPVGGRGTLRHLVLPAVTLGAMATGMIARMTRSSMLEILRQDYIRTGRAKGLTERAVTLRHALRNALIPVVTVVGLQFGGLLAGSVLTETVFTWPGVGRLMVDSITNRDYPVVQGAVLVIALIFIGVNLLVDLAYSFVDPRIRYD